MQVRGWAFVAAMSAFAVPSFAHAQPEKSEAAAPTEEEKKQFGEAREAYDAKRYDEALPKFQMIAAETHSPNARLYVARCLAELKRLADAYDEMRAVANDPNSDPKYAKTKQAAADELAQMERRVGHLQIQLAPELKGGAVTVNNKAIVEDKLGSLTVEPGTEVIEVTRAGAAPVRQSVDVAGGETKSVSMSMQPKTETATPSKGIGTVRAAGIGVAAVGVVGLIAGIGTGVASNGKFSDVQAACGTAKPCKIAGVTDMIDSGKSLEKASTAMFVIGGVFAAASIPMIIFGGPKASKSTDSASARLTLQPTFGGAAFGATGEF